MSRLVIFLFAGRKANMEVQMPYLHHILDEYPEAEVHLWDLTRDPTDHAYVRGLDSSHDGRITVMGHLHPGHPVDCMYPDGYPDGGPRPRGWRRCECLIHKPPYEKPYQWYAERDEYADATFIKIDDDVLFLETRRLGSLIDPLVEHPERVISADVVNNAVCAKYEPEFADLAPLMMRRYNPRNPMNDRQWWALHTDPTFARASHEWFLNDWCERPATQREPEYVRTRPGEAVSINCIAFTHSTMKWLAAGFRHDARLGDEGAVDRRLPWIAKGFKAAHLTFGPQEQYMTTEELDALRERYVTLRKGYLG